MVTKEQESILMIWVKGSCRVRSVLSRGICFLKNPEEFAFGIIRAKTDSAGQIVKGYRVNDNPHALKPREYKEK